MRGHESLEELMHPPNYLHGILNIKPQLRPWRISIPIDYNTSNSLLHAFVQAHNEIRHWLAQARTKQS